MTAIRTGVAAVGLALFAWISLMPAQEARRTAVHVAVAANFADAQEVIAERFTAATGVHVRASVGSTGQLYAQIRNGAPFDVFLAADVERPKRLEEEGLAVAGTRTTYAEGRLALYGPGLDSVRAGGEDLGGDAYVHLAIANAETAPYGAAAEQVLAALGLSDVVASRIVRGQSIGQAYQFVASGAAELGFVALSQVIRAPERSYWAVPSGLHEPIRQDAVLLARAAAKESARRYLEFLHGPEARQVIASFGYGVRP